MGIINDSESMDSSNISVIFNADNSCPETTKKKKYAKMYLVAVAALLNGVCMGLVLGFSSPALSSLRKPTSHIHLKMDEEDWFGSLMGIGALLGGFSGGPLTNTLGRKGTLILCSVLFFFGWDGIPYSNSVEMLYFLRILTGFCSGLVSSAAPMYIIEISTPKVRGFLGSCFQLSVVTGVLVSMSIGLYFPWSWLSVCCAIISIFSLICILPMPESPRWLMMKGQKLRAMVAVKFLHGDKADPQKECENIEKEINRQPQGSLSVKDFKDPGNWKPFLFSLGLMYFQQFSGVNGIMFYASTIFESTGNKAISDNSPVIVAAVQVFATFTASVLMDKAGRRLLLTICGIGTSISLTVMGFYFYFADIYGMSYQVKYSWISLVSLVVFIASFSIGMGPIPWLMVAEMVPQRIRSLVSAVATGFNWTLVFIITFTFTKMANAFSPAGLYWFYASNCFLCVLFSWFILPETKGKRLEDIQKLFKRSSLSFRTKSTVGNDMIPIVENDVIIQSEYHE